jgi:chemotaxis protein methyltransferase CheR
MELSESEFKSLKTQIDNMCGIQIPEAKSYLIKQRLEKIAIKHSYSSFAKLSEEVEKMFASTLKDELIEAITTNETFFFRDDHPFTTFRDSILPQIIELASRRSALAEGKRNKIRIWCAASSTGQEPYCLAMMINDFLESGKTLCNKFNINDFEILATDISPAVLKQATKGEFTEFETSRGLPDSYRKKYFEKSGDCWVVQKKLRDMIKFQRCNLIKPVLYLGHFDFIICRNVLIYFDLETKTKILNQFDHMINTGGILLLGASENLDEPIETLKREVFGDTRYYKKLPNGQ